MTSHTTGHTTSHTSWRIAAGFALAHVVLMLLGLMMQGTPALDEGVEGIEKSYVQGDLSTILTGGYIEVLGFLCLVPPLVFLAGAVGRRTEAGRWAALTAVGFGIGYVAITLSSGFAPGAAALWGAQNGLDAEPALVVNDIRNFAYFISLALLGGHAIGLGVAAMSDGFSPRWVGWGGVAVGTLLLVAVPGAALGLQDYATLIWLVWWIGVAVVMFRHSPATEETIPDDAPLRQT